MGGNRIDLALGAGQVRVDLVGTGTYASLDHHESCPEADPPLCAVMDIPEHLHDQDLYWGRLDPSVAVGLGKGWQLAAGLALDLKVARIDYTTLDGRPYDPPYGNIHHRDETLFGPGDGRLRVRRDTSLGGKTSLGLSGGTTLPFGHTEEDPFALTEQGLEHEHFQRGTGTFVPNAGADLLVRARPVGLSAWVDGRAPLYANGHGYRPGPGVGAGVGPIWYAAKKLTLLPALELAVEGRDRWSGELAPGSGKVAALASATVLAPVTPRVTLLGQARTTFFQSSFSSDEEDQVTQRLVLSLGATFTTPP